RSEALIAGVSDSCGVVARSTSGAARFRVEKSVSGKYWSSSGFPEGTERGSRRAIAADSLLGGVGQRGETATKAFSSPRERAVSVRNGSRLAIRIGFVSSESVFRSG